MADARPQGERVFCHQCDNEWDRAHGGLTCPRCEGDFTEILEPGTTSSLDAFDHPSTSPSPPHSPPLRPLFDHNPWNDDDNDDFNPNPRNNFTTFEFTSNGGGGRISISTGSFRTGGMGAHNQALPPPFGAFAPFGFPRPQPAGFGGFAARDPHAPPQAGNLQDLFSMILQSMQPPGQQIHRDNDGSPGQDHPPHPFDLLNQIFNPGNGRHGDMVFSQEAFDRVMSQLMEQNNASNAPPPASEDAIRSLEKKMVDKDMLGTEGKAECSICMDDVVLNQEVTVLPCKHWFHGDCVTAWLKEHDTCPHCRKPISEHDQNQQPNTSRRRYSRRASSVSSPRAPGLEGTRHNPITIPESPSEIREARRQYYGGPRDGQPERPETLQHSSSHDSRRHTAREASGSSAGSRNQGGGGGVTGWIRDHMPFS